MQQNWSWLEKNEVRDSVSPHTLSDDAALASLFEAVIRAAEAAWDMSCSILLVNSEESTLHTASAPSLDKDYCQAIDGVSVGLGVGSCGNATYTKKLTIVEDTQTHPYWHDFKELAKKANLIACWSTPIIDTRGNVLGTFACYFSKVQSPSDRQLDFIQAAGETLAVAIEQRQLQQVVTQLSYFDSLTGLHNRVAFRRILQDQIERVGSFALLFLDLDNFKEINDSLGHEAGDELIKIISQRFNALQEEKISFSRIGGDEFTIIYGLDNSEPLDAFAERVISIVNQPVIVAGEKLEVGVSIGIVCSPEHGAELSQLMKYADIAMYHAKSKGRNCSCHFDIEMKEQLLDRINLQNDLRVAVNEGQFEVYYQPQVDIKSGRTFGFEALIRWNHPIKGVLSAASFIELLESSGLINSVDLWVLEASCKQLKANGRCHSLSVNISPDQLLDEGFPQKVFDILKSTGFDAQSLTLEVTEHTLIQNIDLVLPTMERLRNQGVRFSIDDFGIGYSSLNYLKNLPVSTIKIDKSFVKGILTDAYDREICISLCALSRNLGLEIIAEGVEREDQIQALLDVGCTKMQGYFLSYPLSITELEGYLADKSSANI
ncbi:EAL domain-containing protein [uncultured Pseudoteredinibacter sp.]|uniref:sensor domain-containing phosphodiesterase n=1 Tax=uncultured Pseudoteredinibacter sp. TaxID=1641701 RepID=UPI002628C143|nr:EAL domain-containing protein [uncultured Pseudoteredinibacter sp.]